MTRPATPSASHKTTATAVPSDGSQPPRTIRRRAGVTSEQVLIGDRFLPAALLDFCDAMKTGIGSHTRPMKGQTDDWLTPPEIIQALGPFDLDPCASPSQPWRTADQQYALPTDGLTQPWHGRVWLNPPYGQATSAWLHRLAKHGNGIALIFARTETAMFFHHVWPKASGLLFLEGRLHFYTPDGIRAKGNSGGPSVLVAYGKDNAERLRMSSLRGAYCSEWSS